MVINDGNLDDSDVFLSLGRDTEVVPRRSVSFPGVSLGPVTLVVQRTRHR